MTGDRFLAASTITFRREPLDVAVARARDGGYDAIDLGLIREFCPHWDPVETTERLTAQFVEEMRGGGTPIRVVTAAPPFEFAPVAQGKIAIQYAEESVKLAGKLGARVVVFTAFDAPEAGESADAKRARIGAALKRLAATGAAVGVTVAIEAPAPNSLCPDAAATEKLLAAAGAGDALRVAFDSAHAGAGGADPAAAFAALARRIAHVQLRDIARDGGGSAPPGEGTIDFDALFAAIGAAGYAGGFSVELLSDALDLDVRAKESARARAFVAPRLAAAGLL